MVAMAGEEDTLLLAVIAMRGCHRTRSIIAILLSVTVVTAARSARMVSMVRTHTLTRFAVLRRIMYRSGNTLATRKSMGRRRHRLRVAEEARAIISLVWLYGRYYVLFSLESSRRSRWHVLSRSLRVMRDLRVLLMSVSSYPRAWR